jgi:hypothetical protein
MEQNHNNDTRSWPGAFGAFKPSREAVRKNLSTLVWLALIDIFLSIFLSIVLKLLFGNNGGNSLYDVCGLFISAFYLTAQVLIYLKGVKNKRVELIEVFDAVKPFWMRMLLLYLLILISVGVVSILAVIGFFVLVHVSILAAILVGLILAIPAIYVALRLCLAPYFLVDKNMEVVDAYKASWEATKGNVGKLLSVIGVFILMALPMITIIGIIATIYLSFMYGAAFALSYVYLRDKKPEVEAKET